MTVFQPKPQFQLSSNGGPSTSAAAASKPAQSGAPPLSYAEYIVQSKSNAAAASHRNTASNLPRSESAEVTGVRQSEPASVSPTTGKREIVQDLAKGPQVETRKETREAGTGQKSEAGISLGAKPVGSGSSIIVSPRQVCIHTV